MEKSVIFSIKRFADDGWFQLHIIQQKLTPFQLIQGISRLTNIN